MIWLEYAITGLFAGFLAGYLGIGGGLVLVPVLSWLFARDPATAGMAVQIGVTALALGLCFFLPSDVRMQRLETSHRDFRIRMEDVARAYHAALLHDPSAAMRDFCAPDAIWRGYHPFNEIRDPQTVSRDFWVPLQTSLTPE